MSLASETHYDIVVVGTGAAGTSAAVEAAERGAAVLLLEKGRQTGGSTNYTEGLFAIDSYLQKEKGVTVSGTEVLQEEVEYSKYKADSRIWRKYIDDSPETVQWLKNQGVEYEGVQAMGAGEATWHIYEGMGDAVIHQALLPQAKKHGVELLTSTSAEKLLVNEQGKITGVKIKDEGTLEEQEVSTDIVILATGGYLDNPDMMKDLTSYDISRLVPVSSGKGTGDGLRLAWNIGAAQYGTGMAMLFGGYLDDPDEPSFKYMDSHMATAAGQQPLLWVNENGERFVNEAVIYNFSLAGNALYTQNKVYSILDQGVIDYMAKDGNFMGLGVYVRRGEKLVKLQEELNVAIAANKPFIFKANSIEELAEKMGVPVQKLQDTISTYNEYCDNKDDKDFGKEPEYLVKVAQGPFYGFKLSVGSFCTMGGLRVSTKNEVLNEQGEPISGLYAAGNDAAGLAGDTYGPNMPGTCVGYAFYSGRNAAKNAMAGK